MSNITAMTPKVTAVTARFSAADLEAVGGQWRRTGDVSLDPGGGGVSATILRMASTDSLDVAHPDCRADTAAQSGLTVLALRAGRG